MIFNNLFKHILFFLWPFSTHILPINKSYW